MSQNDVGTEDQNGVGTTERESDEEKIELFRSLVKEGKSVNKAIQDSGLTRYRYQKYYEEIWSDPEMAAFKPQPLFPKLETSSKSEAENTQTKSTRETAQPKPPETKALDEALKGIEAEKTPTITPSEALDALKWYQREFNRVFGRGMPVAVGIKPPAQEGAPPEAAIAGYGIEGSLKQVKAAEDEAKKLLETLGYKVVTTETPVTVEEAKKLVEGMGYQLVDTRLARGEVDKMLQEAERQWQQQHDLDLETRLEETKIGAAERVVSKAIDKVMEPFTYFLKQWFEGTVEARMSSATPQTTERTETPPNNPTTQTPELIPHNLTLTRYTRERPSISEEEKAKEAS
jgi:hypothetical protein